MIASPWLASSTMAVIDKPQRRRLTVDDFANMCKAGILTADDREEKMPRYAAAGIPEAWLIDVNAKTITVYTQPRSTGYRNTLTLAWTEEVVARAIEGLSLVFEDILPSAYFPR